LTPPLTLSADDLGQPENGADRWLSAIATARVVSTILITLGGLTAFRRLCGADLGLSALPIPAGTSPARRLSFAMKKREGVPMRSLIAIAALVVATTGLAGAVQAQAWT